MLKICRYCKRAKHFLKFRVNTNGRQSTCKLCALRKRLLKALAPEGFKYCPRCRTYKEATTEYFFKIGNSGALKSLCKTCYYERRKEYLTTK